uniref:Uncharacterized protein n=1 Tax=Nelumbo nucifera TaxID=4432 RepID=A0A822XTB8_NELNU|nr:TPA_asm: hypothetical protein HUJ06_024725 [Nelumbo nucifera]
MSISSCTCFNCSSRASLESEDPCFPSLTLSSAPSEILRPPEISLCPSKYCFFFCLFLLLFAGDLEVLNPLSYEICFWLRNARRPLASLTGEYLRWGECLLSSLSLKSLLWLSRLPLHGAIRET